MLNKNTIWIFLATFPFIGFSQVIDSADSESTTSVVTIVMDTTWDHTISDADLVLKIKITDRTYVTGAGAYTFNILKVVKGSFGAKRGNIMIELIEFSSQRFEKRLGALDDDDIIYMGLNKAKYSGGYSALIDPSTGTEWAFFMSSLDYP